MMNRRSFLRFGALAASVAVGDGFNNAFAADTKGMPGATASTTNGKVRGLKLDRVQAFKGMPYGTSTAGSARFMPPAKPQSWTGVRDAFELGHKCPQASSTLIPEVAATAGTEPMGEDCLVLNVWTPSLHAGQNRPVMVWLHGGGYSAGSGGFTIYDGANLARRQDVVVVTLNHRLNVFGFLYLAEIGGEEYTHSSNVGMLDIVAALEWVRDNIAAFGGNPGNVTIFGQSGGGGKVSTLMAMPSAKGLFHRAVAESGTAIKGVPRSDGTRTAELVLSRLGLKADEIDRAQKLPMEQLIAAMDQGGPAGSQALMLAPVVDGRTLPGNPFDPVAPEISADVPLLLGSVATEIAFIPGTPLDRMDDATLHAAVKRAVRGAVDSQVDGLIAAYRASEPKAGNIDLFLRLASDNWMWGSVLTEAERKAALGRAPAYMYYFDWRSPVRQGKLGAFHTVEIPFVFENVDRGKSMIGSGQDRYALSDRMSGAWAAFARSGNPNHAGLPHWSAFKIDERATMFFDDNCRVVNDPRRLERWALRAVSPA
ncbi:MAG: carboxylesterase/lipase family protein [Candidatus Acidiferrales bacterium]